MSKKHKQGIQRVFDLVSTGYDHPALDFFPKTAQLMIDHIQPHDHDKLLDVCTGTGVVVMAASNAIKQGSITGIDLSSGMLQQAKNKASLKQINNAHFCQMDLDHMAIPESLFDIACCSFGLFFLKDMQHGLNNIRQCIKPGGTISISTFTTGSFQPLSDLFIEQFTALGYKAPGLSWERLENDDVIRQLFNSASFKDINIFHHKLGFDMNTAQDWWDIVWNAGYRGLYEQLTEDEKQAFKQQQLEAISHLIEQGNNHIEINVAIVTAIKT